MAVVRPAAMAATKFVASPIILKDNTKAVFADHAASSMLRHVINEADLPLLDVNFCGETMPLDQADVVSRWKHVFTSFRPHSSQLGGLRQKSESFFPTIDPILEKYDIPPDFRYVPLAESGLNAKAISRKGAGGYWQLMPATARELGLKVSGRVDERFHTRKATEAACKYLRRLYTQFGSWSLVAAAYNAGPGFIKAQLRRQADCSYYQMRLPRETRFYLYRVLLYKELLSRPDDYSSFLSTERLTTYHVRPDAFYRQAA